MKNSNDILIPDNEYIEAVRNQEYTTSNDKILFRCPKCYLEKSIVVGSVYSGYTKTVGCGCKKRTGKPYAPPVYPSKEEFRSLFKILPVKPVNYEDLYGSARNSAKKIEFLCGCGNMFITKIGRITSGHTKTCGKCNIVNPKEIEYQNGFKYMGDLDTIKSNTYKKQPFLCKCGTITHMTYARVFSGKQKMCTECYSVRNNDMVGKTFGRLTVLEVCGSEARNSADKKNHSEII